MTSSSKADDTDPPRAALVERWLHLTRTVLPAMAASQKWPIRHDHCFMRVCLDAAIGCRWDNAVRRPAVRNLTDVQLKRAVARAEAVASRPWLLPAMNRTSLRYRRTTA